MSVYEQIASKPRNRRQKKPVNDRKIDQQNEAVEEVDVDDDDNDKTSMDHNVRVR